MENTILGAIASALQLDADTLSTFKDDQGDWLAEAELSQKLQTVVKDRIGKHGQMKVDEGIRRNAEQLEKWAKAKGFQNPDRLKGEALYEALAAHMGSGASPEPGELTPETAKKHPVFKQVLAAEMQAARAEMEAKTREHEAYKAQIEAERVQDVARRETVEALKSAKIRIEATGTDEVARLEALLHMMKSEKVGIDKQTGKSVLLDDDGEPKKDAWGNPIYFAKQAAELAEKIFGKDDFDPKKGSPSPGMNPASGGKTPQIQFKTQADFDNWFANEPDGAKRMTGQTAWLEQMSGGQ